MKITFFLFLTIFITQVGYCQNVKMIRGYNFKNDEINSLMLFQNIEVANLSFESPEIKGKYYEIIVQEYRKGKMIKVKNLFSSEYIKIDSTFMSFKFYSKIENDKMVVFVESPQMYSEKITFNLEKGKGSKYALKDFQGIDGFTNVSINEEFPILAIITPVKVTERKNSYCEVAQSGVKPEKYWEKFGIPHYFVITMKFK